MRRLAISLVLFSFACSSPKVPRDTQMWRVEGQWEDQGNSIRTARATILAFRSSGEYVELHTAVIERPDGTIYFMARQPKTAAVGTWEQSWSKVEAKRQKVVGVPCGTVTYKVNKNNSVTDNLGTYEPISRLVAPEFETFVNQAKAGTPCGES